MGTLEDVGVPFFDFQKLNKLMKIEKQASFHFPYHYYICNHYVIMMIKFNGIIHKNYVLFTPWKRT